MNSDLLLAFRTKKKKKKENCFQKINTLLNIHLQRSWDVEAIIMFVIAIFCTWSIKYNL